VIHDETQQILKNLEDKYLIVEYLNVNQRRLTLKSGANVNAFKVWKLNFNILETFGTLIQIKRINKEFIKLELFIIYLYLLAWSFVLMVNVMMIVL
jgi:hypothetical protein